MSSYGAYCAHCRRFYENMRLVQGRPQCRECYTFLPDWHWYAAGGNYLAPSEVDPSDG